MQGNLFTNVFLPLALAMIMLGMGLSLQLEDFKRITKHPQAVSIGAVTQLILLPIIGFAVAKIVPMQPEMAVGLIILSLCPGGPSSNMVTYLANGDVALSVTLTVLSSIITILTIPLFANLALQHFLGQTAAIALPIGSTMLQIFLITIVPIGLGMYIKSIFPTTALRLEKVANRLAIAFLALIILLILIREWNRLPDFIVQVGLGVVILNILAMLTGLFVSKLFKLNIPQQICIAIEVGIQNGTLAIAITAGLIKNENMAIPAAIYSLFMYITGFVAIYYGRKLSATNVVSQNLVGKV